MTDRAVLSVTGAEAEKLLQGLITNDLHGLTAGGCIAAALLSAQGKILFDFLIHRNGGGFLIDAEAARIQDLWRRLMMYKLRADAEIKETGQKVVWGDGVADPRHPDLGSRSVVDSTDAPAGDADHAALRHRLGIPEGAADFGVEAILALEGNLAELHGVSFTKGCYVGQENTARMHYRNKVRRRILPVTLSGDPAEDGIVKKGEIKVGELMPGRRFALLRMETLKDAPFTCGDATVTPYRPDWLPEEPDELPDA